MEIITNLTHEHSLKTRKEVEIPSSWTEYRLRKLAREFYEKIAEAGSMPSFFILE